MNIAIRILAGGVLGRASVALLRANEQGGRVSATVFLMISSLLSRRIAI